MFILDRQSQDLYITATKESHYICQIKFTIYSRVKTSCYLTVGPWIRAPDPYQNKLIKISENNGRVNIPEMRC
mgnify:CR=1 FL=1